MTKRLVFGLCAAIDASSASSLAAAYQEALVTITQQANVEKGVVRSARVLFDSAADGEKKVAVFEPLIDRRAAALLDEARAAYTLQAAQRRAPTSEPAMAAEAREALTLEFRDFLAGEFDPLPLADLMTHRRAREQAGAIRLVKR